MQSADGNKVYSAVMAMKEAVSVAVQHGDIRQEAVCKGVGMSTSQLRTWLASSSQSEQWDAKVAEWLKRTQGRALQLQSSRAQSSNNARAAGPGPGTNDEAAPKLSASESRALNKLKEDLSELENYIPWNAVVANWGNRRAQWARRVKECPDTASVGKQLLILEAALLDAAFDAEWRADTNRDEWADEVGEEQSPSALRLLLREMEESIRWQVFAGLAALQDRLKKLLGSPGGALLREPTCVVEFKGETLTHKSLRVKLEHLEYTTTKQLSEACTALAVATSSPRLCLEAINAHLVPTPAELAEAEAAAARAASAASAAAQGISEGKAEKKPRKKKDKAAAAGGGGGDGYGGEGHDASRTASGSPTGHASPRPAGADDADLVEDVRKSGAKRSRIESKEAKYEQFKRQQRLHPEYAGVYADTFLEKESVMHHYMELRVFRNAAVDANMEGVLHLEPHTTVRDMRFLLQSELGFSCQSEEELGLSRCAYPAAPADDPIGALLCPIALTQNHKLAHTFFPGAHHVLVVEQRSEHRLSAPEAEDVRSRALVLRGKKEREKILMLDVSRGHERKPIPIFNGADDDPAPNDFTYVTECVVNEGLRLLLGGPLRDPWPCPYLERPPRKPEDLAYSQDGRFLHPAHTIDSVYECTLGSGCGMDCKNRLVQHGPKYRLEVIRCLQRDGNFPKGWGVRSPDFIPKGAFINEYIGEYISDDEAESRGIRYDDQKMSRIMDVVGDGRDVVRMCIDATHFSNLGRFLNHSCDPNVFKQRVFCDHNSRLPRIALFALRDIPPHEELAYDYGYQDVPGKTVPCLCEADNCSKLLY